MRAALDDRRLDVGVRDRGSLAALEPARATVQVRPRESLAAVLLHADRAATVRVRAWSVADVVTNVVRAELHRATGGAWVWQHSARSHTVLLNRLVLAVLEVAGTTVLVVPRERLATSSLLAQAAAVFGLGRLGTADVIADIVHISLQSAARRSSHAVVDRGCRAFVVDHTTFLALEPARAAVVARVGERTTALDLGALEAAVLRLEHAHVADVVAHVVGLVLEVSARVQLASGELHAGLDGRVRGDHAHAALELARATVAIAPGPRVAARGALTGLVGQVVAHVVNADLLHAERRSLHVEQPAERVERGLGSAGGGDGDGGNGDGWEELHSMLLVK